MPHLRFESPPLIWRAKGAHILSSSPHLPRHACLVQALAGLRPSRWLPCGRRPDGRGTDRHHVSSTKDSSDRHKAD